MDFEIHDARFRAMVLPNAPLEKLAEGFRWLEGPVWFADQNCLLFSDLPNNRVMRWSESGGISVVREPAGFVNGHTRDRQGRLIGCSHQHRCIVRTEPDGTDTVLAERYQGKRLNSPNDVIVARNGDIWFTDPPYGIQTDYEGGKQQQESPARVYCMDAATGELRIASAAFEGPNGLCFAPDERRLYVTETGVQFAPAPVQHIGVLTLDDQMRVCGAPAFFYKTPVGAADGIRCDVDGNVWAAAGDGVYCIAPDGVLLGKIKVPFTVSNIAFGGRHRCRLFICGSQTLYAIYTNQRGAERP